MKESIFHGRQLDPLKRGILVGIARDIHRVHPFYFNGIYSNGRHLCDCRLLQSKSLSQNTQKSPNKILYDLLKNESCVTNSVFLSSSGFKIK